MTAAAVTSRDFSGRRRTRQKVTSRDFPATATAALYLRVSTEEQAREGVSLDAQESRLRAYAEAQGLEVVAVYRDEGVSGAKPLNERPEGAAMLAALEVGAVRHVLAYKLDRLFRDAVDCLRTCRGWDDDGVAMHLVDLGGQAVNTGSAIGRFFLGMLAGVAELERNLIAERTSAALRHKVAKGERVGAPPYGYAATGEGTAWVPVPEEQRVLALIRDLRGDGARPLASVADVLNSRGIPTKRGGRWHAASVRGALRTALGRSRTIAESGTKETLQG